MVTRSPTAINDFYAALQGSLVIDDNPQSSEDGSGLHSPTFMDNDPPFDGQSNGFRAPPPDLDIHNVAGLLASHFSTNIDPPIAAYHQSQTYPHANDLHYSSYTEPSPPHVYDHEGRFTTRPTRVGYGAMRPPSPMSYYSGGAGGISNARTLETPRPLSIPSLLPTNPPPTDVPSHSSAEKGPTGQSARSEAAPLAVGTSPISPEEDSAESKPMSGESASHAGLTSNIQQTQKREPSLVVIACRQCRARKIRCDSTRPSCNNCVRRQNECQYDAVPKRRGPDKRPGTRQRSCKKRPADGSMPVKKKQRKSSDDPVQSTSPISISSARLVGGESGRTSDRVASSTASIGTRSSGLSSPDGGVHPVGMEMTPSPVQMYESALSTVGNVSSNQRQNMSLRLDMNFMNRPVPAHAAFGTDQLRSAPMHSLSAPPLPYSQATGSPTGMLSLQTPIPRSAHSPELILPRSPLHQRGPFSMYEEVSTSAMSDHDATGPMYARQVSYHSSNRPSERGIFTFSPSQSVDLTGKLWWDSLIHQYSPMPEHSESDIMKDITFLFSNSIHWLSFINEHHFRRTLLDPSEREHIPPSLPYAALALSTLLQSSELGLGQRGRERAMWLRDAAQSLLEQEFNKPNYHPALAQAAMVSFFLMVSSSDPPAVSHVHSAIDWLLPVSMHDSSTKLIAIFESSAHPQHSAERACNSLVLLDQIIRNLALTAMDAGDPNASVFAPESVPSIPHHFIRTPAVEDRCYCAPPVHSPELDIGLGGRLSPNWSTSISWDPNWNTEEIRREETRRLCWAALSLAAAHTTHCAAFHREPLDLFISRPENYALLFPGEKRAITYENGSPNYSAKQSLWALYCRSMLLWNSCLNLRKSASDSEKAEFALHAWLEAQEIQDGLDYHSCETESHLVYMTKEHLFKIACSYEFRRLQDIDTGRSPMFNRRQAEEWLNYQSRVARSFERIIHDAANPQCQVLARRPFYVWWFMNQFAISISLWVYDNTLVQALELCKSFLVTLDILSALWPCSSQRERYLTLRDELAINCEKAGLPPPPPPDFTLPISLRL